MQALQKGADDYLIKSNEGGRLCKAVRSGLQKLHLRRQVDLSKRGVEPAYRRTDSLIAELREKAEALTLANERKDEFLATLAHELRNPLAPIRNSLQILRIGGFNGSIVGADLRDDGPAGRPHGPARRRPSGNLAHHARKDRTA